MDSLGKARIFSTLDVRFAYWSIGIDDLQKYKATFTAHHAKYRFFGMPFWSEDCPENAGLRDGHYTVQCFKELFSLIYLEDVFVFSKHVKEQRVCVWTMIRQLLRAGRSLKLKKCFFEDCIDYLVT